MRLAICLSGVLLYLITAASAVAQSPAYPTRAVRMVVPFAAGGLNDVLARLISPQLSEALRQPVVVENRPGSGSNIGTSYVAHAAPDGYTLLLSSAALAINPNLYDKLTYDVEKDLAPIIQISRTQMVVMAKPSFPAQSVGELMALVKSQPEKFNYGSSGIGSPSHLATELFMRTFGLRTVHVPYKGAGPALVALAAGEVDMMVDVLPTALPLAKTGRAKVLAVVSASRISVLPNVPTLTEAGFPGYDAGSWNGILAPAGTPDAIIDRLSRELRAIMSSPRMREKLSELSVEPEATTPAEFAAFIRSESLKWGNLIKSAGIRAE